MSTIPMDITTENNLSDFSDLYKDLYGYRPRDQFTWFRGLSHAEQAEVIRTYADRLREAIARGE